MGFMMTESKIEATDRLRQEGRWDKASQFKDEVIKRLRDAGKTKSVASEEAWSAMIDQYPPLSTPENPSGELSLADADDTLLDRLAAVEIDWGRDVRWCYSNLEHPRVRLDTAPSLSAWGLLKIARSDPAKFVTSILPPVLESNQQTAVEQAAPPIRRDKGLAALEALAKQYES
jgi:hypothetical protein